MLTRRKVLFDLNAHFGGRFSFPSASKSAPRSGYLLFSVHVFSLETFLGPFYLQIKNNSYLCTVIGE